MTQISTILSRKGRDVATIAPQATIRDAVAEMAARNIGALVVSRDGRSLDGIISERDIVRRLADSDENILQSTVADVMTRDVVTCTLDASVDELMNTMTERRVRHIPVTDGGALAGIVSIGDVVKSRIVDLELQTEALSNYVSGSPY